MIRQFARYVKRRELKKTAWGRTAALGLTGAAGAGLGVALASVAVGVAGVALWRRLGMKREEVRGQVVLITGSSRGLGLAMAHEFGRLGAKLAICARNQQELETARQQLESSGVEVLAVPCDVSHADDVSRLVHETDARFGRIDILINNAGMIQVGPIQSQTLADFEEAMNVIFWGTVRPTLAVLPKMLERGSGRIANITSIGGKLAVPHLLPYTCAKFAVVGFSEGLRAELSKAGIVVTTVVPGLMRTGSHLNAYFKGDNRSEYTWFSLGATLPLLSLNAQRAARKVVDAVRCGRSGIVLGPQFGLASLFHGVFPGLTSDLLGLVNRFLPDGSSQERHAGKESESRVSRSFVTILGRKAAAKLNQVPTGSGGWNARVDTAT